MSSDKSKDNAQLRDFYDRIYREGEQNFFSKFSQGIDRSETNDRVLSLENWENKSVLDIGCGTGALLRDVADRGASRVTGIDYSNEAILIARQHSVEGSARFLTGDVFEISVEPHDVVISCGTIEHSDNPQAFLGAMAERCVAGGTIVVTCPHFINVRGFVWMALAELLDVPMSLTDLHFVHPWHVERWCDALGLRVVRFLTCDDARGNGQDLPIDFEKRLTNALRDAGIDNSRVPRYLDYLQELVGFLGNDTESRLHGATAVYQIEKPAAA